MSADEIPEWAHTLAVFDTETTGVDVEDDRIVTATVAVIDVQGAVTEHHTWLLNPGRPIPGEAAAIHGVTDEIAQAEGVDAARGVSEIQAKLLELGSSTPVVAFNAAFDFSIMRAESERHGVAFSLPPLIVDPHVMDKQFWKYRKGPRTLTATAELYGVPFENAHDATADAVAAGRLAQAIAQWFNLTITANLMAAQTSWKREQAESFQAHLRRQGNADAFINTGWPLLTREPLAAS